MSWPDNKPYGVGKDAVEALRKVFEEHKYLLTEEEKRRIDEYEARKIQEEEDEAEPFSEYPDSQVMEDDGEDENDRDSEAGGGAVRRGRGPRPSPYARGSWIYGGFNS